MAHQAPLLAIVLGWIICISWRPLVLGFYHDDWSLLTVTSPYGAPLVSGGLSRILYVGLGYAAVTLFGANPVPWHIYGAILVLVTSGFVYLGCLAVARKLAFNPGSARWAACLAALVWMLTPTSLGYAAWPVMFPGLWAVCLMMASVYLVATGSNSLPPLFAAAFCLILSTLIYEAFWFCFVPMAILVFALNKERRWFTALRVLAILGGAQLSVIGWSLFLAADGRGTGKQVTAPFVDILNTAPRWLAELFFTSLSTAHVLIIVGLVILAAVYWRLSAYRPIVIALLAVSIGAATTMTLFYAAGYGMTAKGIFSRTYIAFNVWLALAVCIGALVALDKARGLSRLVLASALIAGLIWIGGKSITQTMRWAEAWTYQQQLLAGIPEAPPFDTQQHTALIWSLPNRSDKVESIGAIWDTTAALYVTRPGWRPFLEKGQLWATASQSGIWKTTWDGKKVSQSWCVSPDVPLWSIDAKQVVIYNPEAASFFRAGPGTPLDC
ncbi:hypothetical protein SAMN05428969_2723 [Devosia sp. YR412]|uniref:hypothetical protein n=1 Tax=Devosia sp. YR412 TaxID=1881030 RepID=UPI0008C0DC07|nr:hypothetical protein [Devosia sp. YR412]SEQ32209.1 hypothetical protein SAMN05428969_2723 [Devosia sp. YR412]